MHFCFFLSILGYRAEFLKLILDAEKMARKEPVPDEDAVIGIK